MDKYHDATGGKPTVRGQWSRGTHNETYYMRKPQPPVPLQWWEILFLCGLVLLGSWLFSVAVISILD